MNFCDRRRFRGGRPGNSAVPSTVGRLDVDGFWMGDYGGGGPGRPPCWRTLEESCKGLGSVSLKINNQHTPVTVCVFKLVPPPLTRIHTPTLTRVTGQWAELQPRDGVQDPPPFFSPVQTGLPRELAKLLIHATNFFSKKIKINTRHTVTQGLSDAADSQVTRKDLTLQSKSGSIDILLVDMTPEAC